MTTKQIARRRGRGLYPKRASVQQSPDRKSVKALPEFLTKDECDTLIRLASPPEAALLMLVGFRAGLRISETLDLEVGDINLEDEYPTLRVRLGKGRKARIVPLHAELQNALVNFIRYRSGRATKLFTITRYTALRWVKDALNRAEQLEAIPRGRKVGTHTFRHSAARWWLMNGVPVNVVQQWLGHSSLSSTLVYLQLVGDVQGFMERVP